MKKFIFIPLLVLVLGAIIVAILPAMMHIDRKPAAFVCCVEMKNLERGLMGYFEVYGRMPTGNNAEIVQKLAEDNPQHIHFWFPSKSKALNEKENSQILGEHRIKSSFLPIRLEFGLLAKTSSSETQMI